MSHYQATPGQSGEDVDPTSVEFDVDDVDVDAPTTFETDVEEPDVPAPSEAVLRLERIGGIDQGELSLAGGITTLSGENATNRTSTLRGLCAALGSAETAPAATTLATDAEEGSVELELGDAMHTRTFRRTGSDTVVAGGDPLTGDAEVVDAFVALLESNPVRQSVERGGDPGELREMLMRPLDTDAIDRKIRELEETLRELDDHRETIDEERDRLPELQARRSERETALEEVETEIAAVEAEVEAYDADEAEAEQADELLEELQSLRSELAETTDQIEYHQETAAEYETEAEAVAEALEEAAVPEAELERIDDELSRVRRRKRTAEDTFTDIDSIIGFNDTLLDDEELGIAPAVGEDGADEPRSEALASALNPGAETVECWTCGSTVDVEAIRDRLDTLRTIREDKRDEIDELDAEIESLQAERRDLTAQREEYDELESRAETLEEQIAYHEDEADALAEEAAELEAEIEELQQRVDETEELRESDLVDAYQRLSELEYDRGQIERELEDLTAEIRRIESLDDDHEALEETREEIVAALETLRGRVESAERATAEAFNEHMERIVGTLEYANIARIWIEHRPGDGIAEPGTFELNVVRERDDGAVYEDSVRTLSESERKVVGLVLALSGYIVHRVYEDVPFIVLDSVEAIDASRIAELLAYFGRRTGFLVTALLPEDASVVRESIQEGHEGLEYTYKNAEDIPFLSE